jgi:type III secretion protein U
VAEKTHKPTQRKLREARKRGEVVKSRELTSFASYIAILVLLWTAAEPVGKRLMAILERAVQAPGLQTPDSMRLLEAQAMVRDASWIVLPLLAVSALSAMIVGAIQVRGVFSIEPIVPKFERIDPGKGLKNLFSTRQLFELLKTLVKTALLTAALAGVIIVSLNYMLKLVYSPAPDLLPGAGSIILLLMRWAAVIYAIGAGLDYAIQYFEFMKQQRMSVEEIRRETREDEGDPMIRSARRSRARDIVYSQPPPEQKPPDGDGQSGS